MQGLDYLKYYLINKKEKKSLEQEKRKSVCRASIIWISIIIELMKASLECKNKLAYKKLC